MKNVHFTKKSVYPVIILFTIFATIASCTAEVIKKNITVSFLERFRIDPVSTEFNAYVALRDNPLKVTSNYFAIPWALLINHGQLLQLPDLEFNGGFTVCQHVLFETIIPILQKMGLDTLFTPHAVQNKHYPIRVLPFPHYAVNGTVPSHNKDILYSFIGMNTHWTRKKLFQVYHPQDAIVKERSVWHFASMQKEQEKKEYKTVLARSRYSLCPRGVGPSTLRFWESLQAGAIPVLIGNDMWLPEPFNWSTCVIIIKENEIEKIATILKSIPLQQEKRMRAACLKAFDMFSGDNFASTIKYHYEK